MASPAQPIPPFAFVLPYEVVRFQSLCMIGFSFIAWAGGTADPRGGAGQTIISGAGEL